MFEQKNSVRTYGLSEIISIVVDEKNTEGKTCSIVPINVEHNCTFVVDSSKLESPKDVRADDCGSWRNNGVRPCLVYRSSKSKKLTVIVEVKPKLSQDQKGPI